MNLRKRSLRSWLTIIGIIIGVFSIVVMISIAQGLDDYIKDQLSFLGNDMISVSAGTISGGSSLLGAQKPLTENEVNALKKLSEIDSVWVSMEGRAPVQYRDKNISMYIVGVDSGLLFEMLTFDMEAGRLFREGERGVLVIGNTIAHETFDEDIGVGRRLIIGNKSFSVIGVMEKGGGLMASMDVITYIPLEDARLVIPEFRGNRDITEIHLKLVEGTDPKEAEERINDVLVNLRKVKPDKKDFTVITAAYINEQVGNITAALGLFLGGIAAISLLVGSIGIANTMFMSIMERTREIGIMKAVGATNSMIMDIFLIESGIIGFVGGILGLILSIIVSELISYFGLPSHVTLPVMAAALFFSFAIGLIAGYVPAQRAAKLDVVEALRFE